MDFAACFTFTACRLTPRPAKEWLFGGGGSDAAGGASVLGNVCAVHVCVCGPCVCTELGYEGWDVDWFVKRLLSEKPGGSNEERRGVGCPSV